MQRKPRERLRVPRPQILVAHQLQRDFRRRGQQQRVEMDVFALALALTDDRDLFVDDIVGRQRVARDEQDEDIAGT